MFTDTPNTMNCDSPIDDTMPATPPRQERSYTPPGAPLRLRRAMSSTDEDDLSSPESQTDVKGECCAGGGVPRVLIPTVDDHRDLGILAGDFIKPDPGLTMRERQTHILSELRHWLSGRIQVHARDVELCDYDQLTLRESVDAGRWPAARLAALVAGGVGSFRRDPAERYHEAAMWAANVCARYLLDSVEPADTMEQMAIGFVTTDELPDGRTIQDLWDAPSVFEPLRSAEPLSLDERIDEALSMWETPIKVEAPLWVWSIAVAWFLIYAWLVAALVDGMKSR
jgi:hypothetical protein